MWSSEKKMGNRKMAALAEGSYLETETQEHRKCSSAAAMLLGLFLTIEVMIAGAMLLNVDMHAADGISLAFIFVVLYFTIVAVLTDR